MTKAVLTSTPSAFCDRLDTSRALATMILNALFTGEQESGTIEERLSTRVQQLRDERARKYGNGVFLFFEASGEIASFAPSAQHDCGSFLLAIDDLPTNIRLDLDHEPVASKILSAIGIAIETVAGFEKLSDATIFFTDEGKPLYRFNFQGHASGLVLQQASAEALTLSRELAARIVQDQKLERILRLLNDSLDPNQEQLRRFLSAWMGLEVFVNKNFTAYEKDFWDDASSGVSEPIRDRYLKRIREVMSDKYKLLDKFVVITADLDPAEADADIETFQLAKKFRDEFSHGELVAENALPTTEIQSLLRKFLRLHIRRI
jgi:hypothetical protein